MGHASYKGFEISPAPGQLESGQWSLYVVITKHHDSRGETLECPYSAANTFDTREEAERAALEFGMKVIDGLIPRLSVDKLL